MLPITFRILRIPTRDCSILCLVKTNLVKSIINHHQSEKLKRGSHLTTVHHLIYGGYWGNFPRILGEGYLHVYAIIFVLCQKTSLKSLKCIRLFLFGWNRNHFSKVTFICINIFSWLRNRFGIPSSCFGWNTGWLFNRIEIIWLLAECNLICLNI